MSTQSSFVPYSATLRQAISNQTQNPGPPVCHLFMTSLQTIVHSLVQLDALRNQIPLQVYQQHPWVQQFQPQPQKIHPLQLLTAKNSFEEFNQENCKNPKKQSNADHVSDLATRRVIKKPSISKRRKNTRKTYNQGHWTKKEHKIYLQFVEAHREIMQKSDLKKQEKIFKQMSLIIKTRSASQCRSHHQKFDPFQTKTELIQQTETLMTEK